MYKRQGVDPHARHLDVSQYGDHGLLDLEIEVLQPDLLDLRVEHVFELQGDVGIFGGVAGPFILKKIGVESKIAKGLAMGAAAHAMGTARAMQLGAVEGAISGLAIGLMGIATAILVPIIARLL